MRYYQFLPLAISTFLWVDCRHIRELTSQPVHQHWVSVIGLPFRLLSNIGAKFFGVMAVGWFLMGLPQIGLLASSLTALVAFTAAETINWPLSLLVTRNDTRTNP